MKGGRRDACPTCLGRASGLEAGEPAVEGEGFRGRGGVRGEAGASSGLRRGSVDEEVGRCGGASRAQEAAVLRECGTRSWG